ncbi:MAG: histidine kinase [Saprospiraceae bacterium]
MKSQICMVLLIWWLSFPIASQTILTRQIPLSGEYKINAMVQDNFGFLWLGTDKGLIVYNGYEDEILASLQSFEIVCLKKNKGYIYAGSRTGQVFKIDAGDHSRIATLPTFTKSKISDIEVRGQDGLWIASYGDGLFRVDHDSLITQVQAIKTKDIYDLNTANNGSLYIASDQGVAFLSGGGPNATVTTIPNLPDYIIVKLCRSARGTIIAATYDRQIFEICADHRINILFDNKNGNKNQNLFCADERLIFHTGNQILEWKNGVISQLNMPDIQDRISSVYVDPENNIWVAGGKSSLYKSGLHFVQFEVAPIGDIQTTEYDGHHFYLGTASGVLVKNSLLSDEGKWLLKGENITTIHNVNGLIWIGTFSNGLFVFDPAKSLIQHFGRLLETDDNTILDIEKTGDANVEISTLAGILSLPVSKEGRPVPMTNVAQRSTLKAYVYDVYRDHEGGVWYGKDRNGVTLRKMGKLTDWKEIINNKDQKIYKLGSVFSIAEGRAGEVFFASSNLGLVRNRDGLWDILPQSFSVKNQIVGLSRLDESHLLLIRNHSVEVMEIATGHVLPFQFTSGGDPGISFLNNFTMSQGDCYFALGNSLVRFSPGAALRKKHPFTRLDKIEVNLESIPQSHNQFEQHQNNLRFSFTAGWLNNPVGVQYAYKLEGFDTDWRYTGDRVVSYPHLAPANYVFKVKASENKSFQDEPITEYTFHIERAFYNTVWFYSLLVLLAIAILWLLQRRSKNVALLRSELSRIKTEAELINLKSQLDPHFLFNTFNTLIGLIEEDPLRGVRFTENLTQFFRLLSQTSQKELIALSEEIQLVETYATILKERFGKNISIQIQAEVHSCGEAAMVPPVALQMLIENAVKHNEVSKARPLTVTISLERDFLKVSNIKNPKLAGDHSLGIGNKNIFERYRLMDLPLPFIKEDSNTHNYYLPIIKKGSI